MYPVVFATLFSILLFFSMICLLELGMRIGRSHVAEDAALSREGVNAIEGAVFGLMGLLVAFTFSGALNRFDARRGLIVEEANDISSVWMLIDVLPPESQPALRDLLRKYLDSRLELYRVFPNFTAVDAEYARSAELQQQIWSAAVAGCHASPSPTVGQLVLPALNTMFDIRTTRKMSKLTHPPVAIYIMLGLLAMGSSVFAGYDMASSRKKSWLHIVGFAAALSGSAFVILDLEYPRVGIIRVNDFDRVLVELRASMK
jgi:hypothetical protein